MRSKDLAMGKLATEGISWHEVYLEVLDATVTIIRTDGGIYFSIADLCDALGITPQHQQSSVRHDARFVGQWRYLPVRIGNASPRKHLCLRKASAALWLIEVDDNRVRPPIRGKLKQIQHALMEAADRLVFGDQPDMIRLDGHRIELRRPIRGQLHFDCLNCGAQHCLTIDGEGVHLELADEWE
jgi:hypothetical protein